jgi:DNA-binding NtrC family response regulator
MKQPIESLLAHTRGLFQKKAAPPPAPQLELAALRVHRVKILGLLSDERDRGLLRASAAQNQWETTFATGYGEAYRLQGTLQAPVVLCDRDLQPDWWSMVEGLAACSGRACVLLVSKVADDYLWNEVVRRGGYDVLSKPLQQDELERAIRLAWIYWSSMAAGHAARAARR